MAKTKRRKKHIKKIGGDPWGALQKFHIDSRYHMTVYPCKPFKHGYEKVTNKNQLLGFDIQRDLSEEKKTLFGSLQVESGILPFLRHCLLNDATHKTSMT